MKGKSSYQNLKRSSTTTTTWRAQRELFRMHGELLMQLARLFYIHSVRHFCDIENWYFSKVYEFIESIRTSQPLSLTHDLPLKVGDSIFHKSYLSHKVSINKRKYIPRYTCQIWIHYTWLFSFIWNIRINYWKVLCIFNLISHTCNGAWKKRPLENFM